MDIGKKLNIGTLFVVMLLLALGCSSGSKYSDLETQYVQLETKYSELGAKYNNLASENSKLDTEYAQMRSDYDALRAVFPLKPFPNYEVLSQWILEHRYEYPKMSDIKNQLFKEPESTRREYVIALEVQAEAARDGYMVSACIDTICPSIGGPGEASTRFSKVYNTAIADNILYKWTPWLGFDSNYTQDDELWLLFRLRSELELK